ncbi:MAG TPA: porin [Phycisphaerales bacterium]|nr:porin [Phycisphaerales bacterium]
MHRLLSLIAGTALAGVAVAQTGGQTNLESAHKAELLADAEARASFLQDMQAPANNPSPGSGWNKGKFFLSGGGTGDNVLNIGGFFQTRYLLNSRDEQPDSEEITHGFQMRRSRIIASGNVWDKNLTFNITGDFSRSSGVFTLLDAWGRYQWDNGFAVRWGQAKVPLLREELVSDTLQLTVERSTVNTVFTQNRSQLIEVQYTGKQFRVQGALSDGINSLNTDFTAERADIGLTGRAEFMFAGDDFKRFDDNTSWQESGYAGMVGGAVHFETGGETGGTTDRDVTQATLDVSVEGDGWNAFAQGVWRNIDAPGGETDDFGVVVQGGVFVTSQVELFARYDVVIPDTGDNFNTVTGGVNYYISPKSHAVKLTGDVCYYIDPTTDNPLTGQNTGANLLTDPEGGQIGLRLQLQVLF